MPCHAGVEGFKALRMLTLGSNHLQDWQSIIALDGFICLKELRVSGNPVIVAGGSGSRYEVCVPPWSLAHPSNALLESQSMPEWTDAA